MTSWYTTIKSFFQRNSATDGVKQSEDLDETSQRLLSLIPCAAVVVDTDGQVIRSNPAAYRFSVVSQDRIVNPQVQQAVDLARETRKISRFSMVTQTSETLTENNIYPGHPQAIGNEASRPNWLKITVGAINDNFVVILIDDASEAKRFEQTRQAFVEHVSKQLFKPIEVLEQLAGKVNNLAEEPLSDVDDAQDRMKSISQDCQNLTQYSAYLQHMLSDLLLLVRAQEQIQPSSTNLIYLNDEVDKVVRSLQPKARKANVELVRSGNDMLRIHGDGEQISAAVGKLVENAIRYSPKSSKVTVLVKASSDGTQAVVQVIDRGKGIAKADQEHVFERFYRGSDQPLTSKDGAGLGLSIAKHVALTHHGSLTFWSAPDQGSTFTLAFPLIKKEVAEASRTI
jgi:two-component system, OmpR family, sensor histidine kinase SenX3